MSNRIPPWKLLGSLGLPLVVLSLPLYTRFRRDIRSAYARVAALHSQLIETPAGRIEYATFGAGYPVLVVHGNCGGFDQGIASARPALGEGFWAIVPSRFGYLRTPVPEHASPASQADAHACLLDYLGIKRAAVIAYSAGATSAIQLALRHPERVSALILSSPNGPGKEPTLPPRAVFNVLFRFDFLFWLITTYFSAGVRAPMGIPKGFELTSAHQAEVAEMMRIVLPVKPRADGVLFDTYVSNPDINIGYRFGEIATPTLVLIARDDPMAPYQNARSLAEQIPGAELLTLERGGHLMLGQRERTIPAIRRFLREHSSTQASQHITAQPARLSAGAGVAVPG
jgi:pimeloyl-ACP methyl ester carboxylesterase